MIEPVIVDLAVKKTEPEWQSSFDRFWLAATPELFKWLGWVAALSALKFVAEKTQSAVVGSLYSLCLLAIFFYFNAFFFRFQFINPPFVGGLRSRWLFSLAISGALALLAYVVASEALGAISKART